MTAGLRPLSRRQTMIWTGQQLDPDAPLYNMIRTFTIEGEVDVAAFQAAFQRLVDGCDALRMVVADDAGTPRRRTVAAMPYPLPLVDLSAEADPDAALAGWVADRGRRRFDPAERLFDAALVKTGPARYVWYLNQHHLIADAWSAALLLRYQGDLYRAACAGSLEAVPDPPSYDDCIAAEEASLAGAEHREAVTYWQQKLAVPPAPLTFYGPRPPAVGAETIRVTRAIAGERAGRLAAFLQRPGIAAVTPELSALRVFHTVLVALLHRLTHHDRLAVGTPFHNRRDERSRRTVGLFMNLYPVVVDISPDESMETLAAKVGKELFEGMQRAHHPLDAAAEAGAFEAVLNYIHAPFGDFAGMPAAAKWWHCGYGDRGHALRVQVLPDRDPGAFELYFDVKADLFDEQARQWIADHFLRVLDAWLEEPHLRLDRLSLLAPDAAPRRESGGGAAPAAGEARPTVVAQFLDRAAEDPGAVAIVAGERTWTFGDVDRLTASVAAALAPGSLVGIRLPRSAEAVIAMLGVLRAGAAYVPIDPDWPQARTEYVAGDAGCAVVVGGPDDLAVPAVTLDALVEAGARAEPGLAPGPGDLAYVLYTSGSTGRPKGVMVEHGALANYVTWASEFYDRGRRLTFPLFSPLTFDLTVTSIFVPLVSGGGIVVYAERDPVTDVRRVFEDDAVDVVKLTPSHLAALPDRDRPAARIGQLVVGGEDLTVAVARRARDRLGPGVEIHNEYGPTEATVGCVVHTYDPAADRAGSVPIGRPITGMRAYVLNPAGRPAPPGVAGELHVAGVGVARGYAGDPRLTAERFQSNAAVGEARLYATGDVARMRPDGTLEYLGRRDDQVKIRGARVELREVEAAVASHPQVDAAAAMVRRRAAPRPQGEDPVLCARCGLASDYPGVAYDDARVCNHCRAYDAFADKARVYFKPMDELAELLAQARRDPAAEYDCIALLSGGKDSTYALCRLVDLGVRPLAFTLDNGYLSDEAKANIRRVAAELGVDHVFGSTPAMNEIFVDSLERHANVCNGCFKTIYTLSLQEARARRIPFIVTGLSRGQFFETRLSEDLFTEMTMTAEQIDAHVLESRKAYHQVDDAVRRLLDVSGIADGQLLDEVRFVDFYRYCDAGLDEIMAYLEERVPWVRPSDTGRSTNCLINDVGIYFHRRTKGFHNYALPYSWDVRLGHKTRAAAIDELDDDIDVARVERILGEIGYPERAEDLESGRRLVAYYASPVEISATELRSHVAGLLPEQMVPAQWVRLAALPLTANGKVDRAALPEPDTARPAVDAAYVAPRSDVERTLGRIWRDVLGIDRIGVRDNFLDLGGDSIMAIQIVARAHRQGLPVTLGQMFESLTVERLAQAAEEGRRAAAERVVGPVELTPIQLWFLDTHGAAGRFHQIVHADAGAVLDAGALARCLADLADHHDALRQSFGRAGDGWSSAVSAEAVPPELRSFDTAPEARAWLERPFDLGVAPLLRVAQVRAADGTSRLSIAAHHLIVDAVSWPTIVDDLSHLYRRRVAGDPQPLPAVTSSLRDWVDALAAHAGRVDVDRWRAAAAAPAPVAPAGDVQPATVRVEVDPETTARLLGGAPGWRIGVDELLAAALAMTLAAGNGASQQRIFLEGHGRESDDEALDVTRTVGWFTSLYPVVLPTPPAADPAALALAVRDEMRRVAPVAREYGLARYLHPDPAARRGVALRDRDHVVFNYFGRSPAAARGEGGGFRIAGPLELFRASRGPSFGAEVSAVVDGGTLAVKWTSGSAGQAAAAAAVDRMVGHLGELIARFEGGAQAATPGDFPLAGLDERGLDKLAAVLRASDARR